MCDYSLLHVASRPAKIEDKLVVSKFQSITKGFASVGEPGVVVCLLPGTELAFDRNVEYEGLFPLLPRKKAAHRVARFRQINLDQPAMHHDALEFPDGTTVLVTKLSEGQHATVLQLPASAQPASPEKAAPAKTSAPNRPQVWVE